MMAIKQKKLVGIMSALVILSLIVGCGSQDQKDLRPRTQEENEAIHNSWYPVKSEECQVLVDSFILMSAAIGNDDIQYLAANLDQIKQNLIEAGKINSARLLELANTTQDVSIRNWALEAVPTFANLQIINSGSEEQMLDLNDYLLGLSKLVEDVPSGCRS